MSATLLLRTRVNSRRKRAADKILKRVGLTTEQFVNLALAQVELKNGVPFPLTALETDDGHFPHVPNAETRAALTEKPGKSFGKVGALMAHL